MNNIKIMINHFFGRIRCWRRHPSIRESLHTYKVIGRILQSNEEVVECTICGKTSKIIKIMK
jgi:hypothetical protein